MTVTLQGMVADIDFSLTVLPIELERLEVIARQRPSSRTHGFRGLDARRAAGLGDFIDREEIERRHPSEIVDRIARSLAELDLTGTNPRTLTLGQVFREYFRLKAPGLSDSWRKLATARRALFEEAWGADKVATDVSQTDVDAYVRQRSSGALQPVRAGKEKTTVRDGTIDGDFRWLSSVFNWARKHKEGGRRLLPENPLHDTEWPKEKNPRRPVASHQRFLATLGHVDAIDESGRLRAILCLARFTGRREGAICRVCASDVLRTPDHIRTALAASGMDERLADHMPHGAVRWSDASDKMGLLFVSPLSKPARAAVDTYLQANPRLGDVPLFPAPGDPSASIDTKLVGKWLMRAEKAARLPKLEGGRWHPYRRLWASERKHLPDVDVAAAGGWKDTRALKLSYQRADPATVLKVVEAGS